MPDLDIGATLSKPTPIYHNRVLLLAGVEC